MSDEINLFELLVDTVRDYAVFILNPDGTVRTWNSGARELKGYEADEIIGRHFSTFYTEEAKKHEWPNHELKMATLDGRFEDEGWRVRKDGSRFWANVIITAMREPGGKLLGFSKITRDLTTRRQSEELLRQSEERFRLLIEGVVDYAVYMLDPQGRITSWNTGAQRLNGYMRDEVLGKHFSHFYPPEEVTEGKPWTSLALARLEGHIEEEGWRIRKDGSKFWARVVINALHDSDGRLRGFAEVTQDLTARAHAQQLERASRHMTEFIAILAHELRNPLAPIRNALALMRRATGNPVALESARQIAERQAAHLSRIVDDLIDVSRVTRGTLTIEESTLDLTEVVARSVEVVEPEADRLNQTISVAMPEGGLRTKGDADRLTQLLVNLLTNSVRFTPKGGRIDVKVAAEAEHITISVSDTGRGIAGEDLQGIFGMFVQGKDALHRVGGGLGVGLSLARRIVELHNGTLEARSPGPSQGSTFIVRLPRHMVEPAKAEPTPDIATVVGIRKRVLVIDDNEDAANSLELLLQSLGHETRVAHDGETALIAADEFRPDVVLLDIGMPGMNGYEVARHLRTRKLQRLKIVAVTGWGTDEDRARSTDAGFDLHLVKPVSEAELRQLLVNGATKH